LNKCELCNKKSILALCDKCALILFDTNKTEDDKFICVYCNKQLDKNQESTRVQLCINCLLELSYIPTRERRLNQEKLEYREMIMTYSDKVLGENK